MSRSRQDIHDTEAMLERLTALLVKHHPDWRPVESPVTFDMVRPDAESLRRISMTLHRWHELECGDSNAHGSWCVVRGKRGRIPPRDSDGIRGAREFIHDDDATPFMEHHHYLHGHGKDYVTHSAIPDREAGAKKRLAQIIKRYPGLTAYVQTDPRGCALYLLKESDIPPGADIASCYNQGLAVYR